MRHFDSMARLVTLDDHDLRFCPVLGASPHYEVEGVARRVSQVTASVLRVLSGSSGSNDAVPHAGEPGIDDCHGIADGCWFFAVCMTTHSYSSNNWWTPNDRTLRRCILDAYCHCRDVQAAGLLSAWILPQSSKCSGSDDVIPTRPPIRVADHPAVRQLMSRGLLRTTA